MGNTKDNTQQHRIIPAAILGTIIGLVMAAGIAGYLERETLADIYFYLTIDNVTFEPNGEIRQ
ncbi:conserved hypothetical protein (plasmid) [Nitrosococcus halophilus Nc 4]|uniref:Uncharacterized protein n=1 Tax=Nitrosococcus halophilus (strain Nc4) TaxID=472759 RepID=D5C5F0_NITHN|nr:hypothetical protein [Nitrosococcus halophilus]ADE17004.1 conserved hypothetical protein [Nitrosococcus halophilus Nc 4]